MTPEHEARVRTESDRRELERLQQAGFGWHEVLDRDEFEPIAERFFATFFPTGKRSVPAPFITWDVSHATSSANSTKQRFYIDDLHRKCLRAMKSVGSISEWLVLENINHPWYRVNLNETPVHIKQWPVDLLPWADPCYLIAHDFSSGFIADLDRTITAFGQPLMDAIQLNLPEVFTRVIEST